MSDLAVVRPGLWANRAALPSIKRRLREKVTKLSAIDVRRIRQPYYNAILEELLENGYIYTATYLQQLILVENELYEKSMVKTRLFDTKDFLLAISDSAKVAERYALIDNEKDIAFQMLLEIALIVEEQGRNFWWLAGQVYQIIFKIINECGFTNDEIRCRTRYHYANFLKEKLKTYREAMKEFSIAKIESDNTDWLTNRITYQLLSEDISRGYISAIVHEAKHIKHKNIQQAESLMAFALELKHQTHDKTNICEEMIIWSEMLVEVDNINKAMTVLNRAMKYAYANLSIKNRCHILLKQGLYFLKSENFEKSIKKLERTLQIADAYILSEFQAQARLYLGTVYSKVGKNLRTGIQLLTEAVEIFKNLDDRKHLRKAEYLLSVLKANQIFDDVVLTIRKSSETGHREKFNAWHFDKDVIWRDAGDNDLDEDIGKEEEFDADDLFGAIYDENIPADEFDYSTALSTLSEVSSDFPQYTVYWHESEQVTADHIKTIIDNILHIKDTNFNVNFKDIVQGN